MPVSDLFANDLVTDAFVIARSYFYTDSAGTERLQCEQMLLGQDAFEALVIDIAGDGGGGGGPAEWGAITGDINTQLDLMALLNNKANYAYVNAADNDTLIAANAYADSIASGIAWSTPVDADIVPAVNGGPDLGSVSSAFSTLFVGDAYIGDTHQFTDSGEHVFRNTTGEYAFYQNASQLLSITPFGVATGPGVPLAVSGNISVTGTVDGVDVADLQTLQGVSSGSENLGAFTGTTISDDQTIKAALQQLELAVEGGGGGGITWATPVNANIMPDATGTRNIGGGGVGPRFNGVYAQTGDFIFGVSSSGLISTTGNISAGGNISVDGTVDGRDVATDGGNQDALQALTGVAAGSSDLGTFTGGVIPDGATIKPALQALETAVEAAGGGGITWATPIDTDVTVDADQAHAIGALGAALSNVHSEVFNVGAADISAFGASGIRFRGSSPIFSFMAGASEWFRIDSSTFRTNRSVYINSDAYIYEGLEVNEDIIVGGTVNGRDIVADATAQNQLQLLTGMPLGSTTLGTFSGTTISDNQDIHAALQELESAVESVDNKFSVVDELTTVRTLQASDAFNLVVCNNPGAVTVNVNTGVFSEGDVVYVNQQGVGQVTLAGTATAIVPPSFTAKTMEQHATITLMFISATEYILAGIMEAA